MAVNKSSKPAGSTALTTKKADALTALAERLQVAPEELKETLKATAFKECKTDAEFMAAVIIANTYGLNPILKEIYAFPSQKGVVPIVPIDGWVSLVNRQDNNNGVSLIENEDKDGKLKSVTATFYLKNTDHPVVVTEYLDECNKGTDTWKKWPRRMLRHKAYIQGARIAHGFSGIYDPDEGERIVEAELVDGTGGAKPATMAPPLKEPEKPAGSAMAEGTAAHAAVEKAAKSHFPGTATPPAVQNGSQAPKPQPQAATPKPAAATPPADPTAEQEALTISQAKQHPNETVPAVWGYLISRSTRPNKGQPDKIVDYLIAESNDANAESLLLSAWNTAPNEKFEQGQVVQGNKVSIIFQNDMWRATAKEVKLEIPF